MVPFEMIHSPHHFHHLTIPDIRSIHRKPDQRAHFVPALLARRPGIHVQTTQLRVVHHFQDMGVAGNEEPGTMFLQQHPGLRRISTWITTDVDHQHFQVLARPATELGVDRTDVVSVDVAIDAGQRPEIR